MALFNAKKPGDEKRNIHENNVYLKLTQNSMLDTIISFLSDNTNAEYHKNWMIACAGYYDSCYRTIKVERDYFEVKWDKPFFQEKQLLTTSVTIGFRYTDYGFSPLSSYIDPASGTTVPETVVLKIWASVIREKMKMSFPLFELGEVETNISGYGSCSFYYKVPAPEWKTWF